LTTSLCRGSVEGMLNTRTLDGYLKARGWTRSELARRVGVSRQAVSLWFRGDEANLQSLHLMRLAEVLGVTVEDLATPLPCFDPPTRARLRATLLWDRLYPDLDDLAVALNAGEPIAVARFVQMYGLYAGERTLGAWVWAAFPDYRRYLHPARRAQLEILWEWHKGRKAA
jgi:transcriptional regulator with XRE-family HTH domain